MRPAWTQRSVLRHAFRQSPLTFTPTPLRHTGHPLKARVPQGVPNVVPTTRKNVADLADGPFGVLNGSETDRVAQSIYPRVMPSHA